MLNFAGLSEVFALLTFLQIWNASGYPANKKIGTERESTPIKAVSQLYRNIEATFFSRN
jgi:hypothetical protein